MILDVKSVRVFKVHGHHSKYSVRCLVFPFDYASFAERIFVVGEVAGSINVQSNLRMKCQRYIIHPIRAPIHPFSFSIVQPKILGMLLHPAASVRR